MLEGPPHDHRQRPHRGNLIRCRIRVSYGDGTTETVEAGELSLAARAHRRGRGGPLTVELSTACEINAVLDHVQGKPGRIDAGAQHNPRVRKAALHTHVTI